MATLTAMKSDLIKLYGEEMVVERRMPGQLETDPPWFLDVLFSNEQAASRTGTCYYYSESQQSWIAFWHNQAMTEKLRSPASSENIAMGNKEE